jgi:hypothetical protein
MTKRFYVAGAILGAFIMSAVPSSYAAGKEAAGFEVSSISARIKAGASYYSHLDFNPNSASLGLGVDVGFKSASGFGVTAGARILQDSRAVLANESASINSRYFGVAPEYTLKKGNASLSANVGLGILTSTTQRTSNMNIVLSNSSRMAIAPGLDFDVLIGGGATLNVSVQYLVSLGSKPSPWVFLPMAGIGWNF